MWDWIQEPQGNSKLEYKTFNEWSQTGYKIKKGSKATWINGIAMFSLNDVVPYSKTTSDIRFIGIDDDDYEEDSIYAYLAPNR